ncbi:Rv3654c family TadE-like protein [Corynebacterium alimapuense]|uniref:TadE-like protein n=1 Tax=Corynebacterium alimapuense TaxID=1576874 RepID=A0A3M8K8B4_9CORY|nr:Rv3654c family TadE-like protein [Corynebacterium alimapuense]RNE49005.1 TadE-like protein [Corynebacterium alimapuense]
MRDSEAGYATVATAGFAAALVAVCAAVGGACALVISHHEAKVAADLAAVAGAFALYRGADGCTVAEAVAGDNGASISSCEIVGSDLTVAVKIRAVQVSSTAGPV